jgi:hypothetical protein
MRQYLVEKPIRVADEPAEATIVTVYDPGAARSSD